MTFGILSALALFSVFSLHADQEKIVCEKFQAPLRGGFCIHTPARLTNDDVLYYFHGMGGDEFRWQNQWYYPAQIRTEWKARYKRVPTVISISFGPLWILAEKNPSPASGLFEVFKNQVLPAIEARLGGLKGRRILVGESMGGFNGLQIALKTDLFSKAAILCAPMSEVSPFAPDAEIEAYVKTTTAWHYFKGQEPNPVLPSVRRAIALLKGFYPTQEDWNRSDPLLLSKLPRMSAEFYIASGAYDHYASYEANLKFSQNLKNERKWSEWRPQWGGHCAIDIRTLARFLVD